MMKKSIAVIIPVYNSETTVINTLESVRLQTYGAANFQIILVNDGSTDQSLLLIEEYIKDHPELQFLLFSQENGGVSNARNTALRSADADYIALLDADDQWLPEKIERQMKYLGNPAFGIDFLACKRTHQQLLFPYKADKNHLAAITFRRLMIRNEAQPSSVIFKRKVLKNTGFFSINQRYAEDINYWLKVSLNNKMFILDEELIFAGGGKRTFGISGLSANLKEMEKGFQKNLRDMLLLKRIGWLEYRLYSGFYTVKYGFRLLRNNYLKLLGK